MSKTTQTTSHGRSDFAAPRYGFARDLIFRFNNHHSLNHLSIYLLYFLNHSLGFRVPGLKDLEKKETDLASSSSSSSSSPAYRKGCWILTSKKMRNHRLLTDRGEGQPPLRKPNLSLSTKAAASYLN